MAANPRLDRIWRGLAIAVVALLVVSSPLWAGAYLVGEFATAGLFALSAIGLNFLAGMTGELSFGQAAFFGLGGYCSALLGIKLHLDFWASVFLAEVLVVSIAFCIGLVSLQLRGILFAIMTLAFAEMARVTVDGWDSLTRGPSGLYGMPKPALGLGPWSLRFDNPTAQLELVVVACALALLLTEAVRRSHFGRAMVANRENPRLAEAIGIDTNRIRLGAFCACSAIAAIAGALYGPATGILTPDVLGVYYSAMPLLVIVIGGLGRASAPLVGSAILFVVPDVLGLTSTVRLMVLGLILMLIVILAPGGVVQLAERLLQRGQAHRLSGPGLGRGHGVGPPGRPPTRVPETAAGWKGPSGTRLLRASNLTKKFDGLVAVDDVDLELHPGQILGLIGPNGAGKSTLFDMLTGFTAPSSGSVRWLAEDITRRPPHAIARRGLVRTFQHAHVFKQLTVLDNVITGAYLRDQLRRRFLGGFFFILTRSESFRRNESQLALTANGLLASLDIAHRRESIAGTLPAGELRRLSIAVALAANPTALLLDEPAAGLNEAESAALVSAIRLIAERGTAVIVVEHDMHVVMGLCQQLLVLNQGRRIFSGAATVATSDPVVTEAYLGSANAVT